MRHKDIKNFIKSKAHQVELKDQKLEILARVKDLTPKEIVLPQKKTLQPQLLYAGALLTIVIVVITVFILAQRPTESINPPEFENIDNVVMFSSISTTSLLNDTDDAPVYHNLVQPLSVTTLNQTFTLDENLKDLSKYLNILEQLFASQKDFNQEFVEPKSNYGQSIRFKSKDFLNEQFEYRLNYNQAIKNQTNQTQLEGEIIVGSEVFIFNGETLEDNPNALVMITSKNTHNFVETKFEKYDDYYTFEFIMTLNDMLNDHVIMKVVTQDDSYIVELQTGQHEQKMNYTFEMGIESRKKMLNVHYESISDPTQTGELKVRIDQADGMHIYFILVKPDHDKPYMLRFNRNIGHKNKK